jgi:hypothetical protein
MKTVPVRLCRHVRFRAPNRTSARATQRPVQDRDIEPGTPQPEMGKDM